jgi:hypothetical protein
MLGITSFRNFASRSFATAAAGKEKTFKPKTTAEIWLGDTGVRSIDISVYLLNDHMRKINDEVRTYYTTAQAYPVMAVIVFAVVFPIMGGYYITTTTPDARITKSSRKSLFRGELKGLEN